MLKKLVIDHESQVEAHSEAIQNLEQQIGQLSSSQNTRLAGALPSDTEANPKAHINVLSLRNRRELVEVPSKKRKQVTFIKNQATTETESETATMSEKPIKEAKAKNPQPIVAKQPPPFPQTLQKRQINIPLVDILQEVPKYAMYIKEIMENKRKLTKFETLGLGDPRPTTVVLRLSNRSLANSEGIIEYLLVQVVTCIFPADLVILDYESDQEVPFILGRPFLATSHEIIDVCEGQMTMRLGDKTMNILAMITVLDDELAGTTPYLVSQDPQGKALMTKKKRRMRWWRKLNKF
ncbi:PREDICTED: uncharacterized protein LOC109233229 [Nicotiana attenuata]|uniref:uncharacterized protein LOC109233229 n=1 Tax=Nicotiana attenuata TaxID=49451 RepID=UPI0009059C92|nr:PREDICTED: uncharacterized protein LOC109233229 [Nicotiana attenuata]